MFNLIITVISIALVAALALASIYYGGPALSKGSAKATAATLVNQGQQISGANTMYAQENGGADAAALSDLQTAEYLSSVPTPPVGTAWAIDTVNDVFTVDLGAGDTAAICDAVNSQAGLASAPSAVGGSTFGCVPATTGTSPTNAIFFYAQ
jgi:hypothetical protein